MMRLHIYIAFFKVFEEHFHVIFLFDYPKHAVREAGQILFLFTQAS